MFLGQIVCEGEGHLNIRSCLLEGPVQSRHCRGRAVKLDIPDTMTCSLFPGQVGWDVHAPDWWIGFVSMCVHLIGGLAL